MGNRKKVTGLIVFLGICFICKTAIAQTWLETKRLTWTDWGEAWFSDATIDKTDTIHVVWHEFDEDYETDEIKYKKSSDGGTTWTATKRLAHGNSGQFATPSIASDTNNHLHVVWNMVLSGNWEIIYTKSTNGGNTWSSVKRLIWTFGASYALKIAVGSNSVIHIVWMDDTPGNMEIYYKRSTNGGLSWTTKRLTYNSGYSRDPVIAVDSGGKIHVVWEDNSPGNSEVYYKISTNGGSSWTTRRATWNSGYSRDPVIAMGPGNTIHVVWSDSTPGNYEIFYKRSTNGGATWTTKRLTYNSGMSLPPTIAVDSSDNIHVVWQDDTPGNDEIYYKRSTNGGLSWTTKRLSWNLGYSTNSCVTTDSSNNIYVIWSDNTPGNRVLLYKKGIQ